MKYRTLGRSGLKVTEISYGNWLTHGSQIEADVATSCVHAALDAGITTFDSADAYANRRAETVLGEALKGQQRENLEICTKVYWPVGQSPNARGLSRKHLIEGCDGSLRRLQVDYIDLYQAHRYDVETPLEETMMAFDHLVRQGKVMYIGVSEWTAAQIAEAQRIARDMGLHRLISNQPQYSMLYRVIEAEVVPTSRDEGLGQIVWSPIAQGVLTGKYLPGQPPPEGTRATHESTQDAIARWMHDDVLTAVQNLRPLAAEAGLSMAQLAVAWVLQNDNVGSAIIGATRPEQVRDNVGASGIVLEAELMTRIDAVLSGLVLTDPRLTKSPEQRP